MLRIEMLPAAQGDCLWVEYGTAPNTRVVIIDGGVRATATTLRNRIARACKERDVETLDVELIVVTHIDNDHILGIIELLKDPSSRVRAKDIWFNGRPQLAGLPPLPPGWKRKKKRSPQHDDLLGNDDDTGITPLTTPADLLGPAEGDELSKLLGAGTLPWNQCWTGSAVMVSEQGTLPVVTLDGGLNLTLLGPNLARLHDLCAVWSDVLGGAEDEETEVHPEWSPVDLLGRGDKWPPVWNEGEKPDPSVTNGSSIMMLAEYDAHALLLTGDAHASDISDALDRLRNDRPTLTSPLQLAAFKLSHHGSDKNLTQVLLEKIDCDRYLVSTDGTSHRHPDQQALLRILRYSKRDPQIMFNAFSNTTQPWGDSKRDVVAAGFRNYEPCYPDDPAWGYVLELD